jgi:hypothetical protein
MLAQPFLLLSNIYKIAHFLLLFKLISQPKTLNRCKEGTFYCLNYTVYSLFLLLTTLFNHFFFSITLLAAS